VIGSYIDNQHDTSINCCSRRTAADCLVGANQRLLPREEDLLHALEWLQLPLLNNPDNAMSCPPKLCNSALTANADFAALVEKTASLSCFVCMHLFGL